MERSNNNEHTIRDFGVAASTEPIGGAAKAESFQQRVQPWMMECFGPMIAGDREERNHRFLEEALELVQATGCTASEAHQLVDYVYGRPVGEPAQEVGGVMVTLAALCLANALDMHQCGETELARIWTKVEAIRAKQAAKPKYSPLPAEPNDDGLLPCPFCAASPLMQEHEAHTHGEPLKGLGIPDHAGSFTVECPTTNCCGMIAGTRTEVIAAWNRRAAQPPADAAPVDAKPVAMVDAGDDGMFASILPDVSVKVGDLLYAAALPSPAQGDAVGQVAGMLTREQQENAAFLEWWEISGQKADHDLRTQNAAHAAWQERAQRAASVPEYVHVDVANQAINDALRVGMQDSERDAARWRAYRVSAAAAMTGLHSEALDEAVDKLVNAMAAQQGEKGGAAIPAPNANTERAWYKEWLATLTDNITVDQIEFGRRVWAERARRAASNQS